MTDARDPETVDRQTGRPTAGRKALGKGLGALIGESRAALGRSGSVPTLNEGRLRELLLSDIDVNPRQPRRAFSDDELQDLADSIRALGVVQPVVVRPVHEGAAPGAAHPPRRACVSSSSPASAGYGQLGSPASSTSPLSCDRPTRWPRWRSPSPRTWRART